MAAKAETFVTFAVTFQLPAGMSLQVARQEIRDALVAQSGLGVSDNAVLKVSLSNKEVKYGKR